MEENFRENIMKVWKDYTVEDDVIIFIEKVMKAIKPEVINSCWRKLSRWYAWFHRICDRANHERDCRYGKKKKKKAGGEGFQDTNLGEIQESVDTMTEELTTGMDTSAFKPVPQDEEDNVEVMSENTLTLDSLAEGF